MFHERRAKKYKTSQFVKFKHVSFELTKCLRKIKNINVGMITYTSNTEYVSLKYFQVSQGSKNFIIMNDIVPSLIEQFGEKQIYIE